MCSDSDSSVTAEMGMEDVASYFRELGGDKSITGEM